MSRWTNTAGPDPCPEGGTCTRDVYHAAPAALSYQVGAPRKRGLFSNPKVADAFGSYKIIAGGLNNAMKFSVVTPAIVS
jgi:hypothetical protein